MAAHLHRPSVIWYRLQQRRFQQHRFVQRVSGLAAAGFAAGAGLAVALLITDSFGLGSLVAADASPQLVALLFAGGLGLLFMPVSLATGLGDPIRSEDSEITLTKGRRP